MEFSVPQFIEMETKIVGPFTWRQFIYIGGAGVIIFFLFFVIKQFLFFIMISIFLATLAFSFALLKIGGRPLPNVLVHFLIYSFSSKIYIWQKKSVISTYVYKKEAAAPKKKEETKKGHPLKITAKSRLKELSTQVELKTK